MMPIFKNIVNRVKSAALTLQVLFVALAFALMVISSYLFVSEIERGHLAKEASSAISYTQTHIESDIREAKTMLDGISQTMRGMLIYNTSLIDLRAYMDDFTRNLLGERILGFSGLYGHFDAHGWVDTDNWGRDLPEDYVAVERPWHRAAVAAEGRVAVTDPYRSFGGTRKIVVTLSRRIFDRDGNPLGVIAMDMNFEMIAQRLSAITLTKGSYAVLVDGRAMIIAHPKLDMLGKKMSEVSSGLAELENDLLRTGHVSEREVYNAAGERVIAFFNSMENGWQIGVITPKEEYYKNIKRMAIVLSSLGTLLAALLSMFLLRASRARRKADEFTRVMFSAMPLACQMWNKDLRSVMCNDEAIRVYRVPDKKEFLDNFFEFSPPYQPCGRPSKEKGREYLHKGFKDGYFRFEWIHRRGDGEDFPCEITMVGATFNGEPALLTYTRDLSEEKAAMAKLREVDEFTQLMFTAMPLACHMWTKDFRTVMCNDEAMRIYGATDQKHFLENFFPDFSPEFQPCGTPSKVKGRDCLLKGFEEGYVRFEWTHKKGNGEEFPCEIIAIRATYKGEAVLLSYTRDLSEEKTALEKLREADERIKSIFDATPLAITLWNPANGALLDCNLEAIRIVGMTDKKTYIEKFASMTPEYQSDGRKTTEKFVEIINATMRDGVCRHTWDQMSIDGEVIPFSVHTIRLRHMGDNIISYAQDVREINAAIARTREADERRQSMFDATPLGITLWAQDGTIVDCNMEAVRVVGHSSKEEYVEKFADLLPEYQSDGRKTVDKFMDTLTETFKNGSCHISWDHMSVDGELIPFDITTVRLKHKDGYIAASYARDMREINAATAKVRESDARAQIMIDATPISCTLFNDNMKAVECNHEALKMLGMPDKQEYLDNMLKFSPEYQPDGESSRRKSAEMIRKTLEDGYNRFEWTHIDVNGELVPCEITLVRVMYGGKHTIAGYARDLREVKAMIKEMHRAEIAEESNQAKSKFLAAMSHEIRTPMNVILGVTEIQLQDETLAPHVREAFVQVYNSSDLLLGIINDILDLSKIEAEKMEFAPAKYELASLINDTAHLNMMRNSKPIVFELSVDPNAPSNLYGDELRIKQILNNLLSNSFKFTEEGRIKLHVSVEDGADGGDSDNDVTLVLTVSDTGQGMSKEQLDMLFTEYTRFNLDANRTIQGTGLGMNITRRLVSMMGGVIKVDSKVAGGTTITVRLPQKRAGDERIGPELAENLSKFRVDMSPNMKRGSITREYMPYGRVLIVDDVESNLYVAKGLMAPYGLTIDTANNGFEAVEKVQDGALYDVIFMDHMMPKMDGIEATKIIRDHGYCMPIVALTANAVIGQADMFLKSGFDDFISKPIDIRQLNSTLNKLIRDRQPPDVIEKAHRDMDAASRTLAPPSADAAAPELLAVFARDAIRAMPILESAATSAAKLSKDDLNLFTTSVHGLKAALANIGEKKLSQTALALETAGKSGDVRAISLQTANFIKALNKIVRKAESEYDSAMAEAAEHDENPEYLREQMAIMAKACREYDESTVLDTLESLKKMSLTRKTGETLIKISELLLHSDFDEAAEVAEKFE